MSGLAAVRLVFGIDLNVLSFYLCYFWLVPIFVT